MPNPGDLGDLSPEPVPAFVKPTKCRTVLFYPWDYGRLAHGEPVPAIVTHVGDGWVHLIVLDATYHSACGTYPAQFIRHRSVLTDSHSFERWDWPPRG